ncbi:MAG: hypothetical protein MK033_10860 [Candidatus Caenarcaniphilales bacterium]|nr:hypothetical protein [Candidatus Caenarcaniphilales bacterium]
MSVVFENPESILELIKSANSFHGLTCSELMNCDSTIAWFRNINCPEFKTAAEVFRGSLDELLSNNYLTWLTNFRYNKDSQFSQLLTITSALDIGVLTILAPFTLEVLRGFQNIISGLRLGTNENISDKMINLLWYFSLHLVFNLMIISLSNIEGHANLSGLMYIISLISTVALIFYLRSVFSEAIKVSSGSDPNKYIQETLLEDYDKKMEIKI